MMALHYFEKKKKNEKTNHSQERDEDLPQKNPQNFYNQYIPF